jgi:hypothetical protein
MLMGKNAVLEAGLLLEGVARKIRRHNGEFSNLEFLVLRLHIETALEMLPNPPRPGAGAIQQSDNTGSDNAGVTSRAPTTRRLSSR